ncbi:MAG: phenylalanine--tRNA ligase subunit alpha [Candidatus Edwardsbacteria bacterium]
MEETLRNLSHEAEREILEASDLNALEGLRVKYLGRKSSLIEILHQLGTLPLDKRRIIGKLANEVKEKFTKQLQERRIILEKKQEEERLKEAIDITLPGKKIFLGKRHPLTQVLDEIVEIFLGMGFSVAEGPDIETEYYNFEALNTPKDHPARDEQDTFYITDEILLRTQTSPVQIRVMERQKPPVRIIAPGRCYRRDAIDASHLPMFHQVEGLYVDKNVTFADLKATLIAFARAILGEEVRVRFRPHFFPFTEPSAEYDFSCIICGGKGCRSCQNTGWMEISGAGMVHPQVFRNVGYDPEEVSGFAFGMGVERIAMLKFGIDDIRLFYENDLRFLAQF